MVAPRPHKQWRLLQGATLLALTLALFSPGSTPTPAAAAGSKLALAFYYMWYGPDSFSREKVSDVPASNYISDHQDTIARQLGDARLAGLDGFIVSWWGKDDFTDRNFSMLLDQASGSSFQSTIYFETGGNRMSDTASVIDQLRYLGSRYMSNPNFLHYGGKPVIFIWRPDALAGGLQAWAQVRAAIDPNHQQIWSVETTNVGYLDVFDGIHLFSAAKWAAPDQLATVNKRFRTLIDNYNTEHGTNKIWAAGAMPGYDDSRLAGRSDPVVGRSDGSYYQASLNGALSSNPDWLTITSYNEWYEGTQIEPSASYGSRYLQLTNEAIARWKGADDPCAGGNYFTQTSQVMCKAMASYWQRYGGLAQFGYPIGPVQVEKAANGQSFTVQYFERARFELHPEYAGTENAVMLGQLGRELHTNDPAAAPAGGAETFFPETGHNVGGVFLQYWQAHGGLFVNGYPLTEVIDEKLDDGRIYKVQYFERARFEYHPENAGTEHEVLLGFLGKMALARSASTTNR